MKHTAIAAAVTGLLASNMVQAATVIVAPTKASRAEKLAERELQRYIYLRTGGLAEIADKPASQRIVVARKGGAVIADTAVAKAASDLRPQEYLIRTTTKGNSRTWWIVGGDDPGTLYGAYRFVERLGVRFYLHGDVIPDKRLGKLPVVNETGKPIFALRGIQPFHDFPEGPDWWNTDDYLAYVSQLPKLRMNFIGFHCYPEWSPEPAVWIGDKSDVEPDGKVRFSYPARWANTALDGSWLYAAMPTSAYASGASLLFPGDAYGNDVMNGYLPAPKTVEESNQVFNNTADMFRSVFSYARELGIKTCVGTETPLQVPAQVREHLKQQGKDASARSVYEGMFTRIARAHPVDYYWLWTPEVWTAEGNTQEQVDATIKDFQSALAALDAVGKPFTLASCGWVLGPLDRILPKDSPMSCINRAVGHEPIEPGFAEVKDRPKWAIPWLENDGQMIIPQSWVGRMRHDAVDARSLGCDGLLGIHWRTKVISQNISALAAAGWDQSWAPATYRYTDFKKAADKGWDRTMPTTDFYTDFARANFGDNVAASVARILASVDGRRMPMPAAWNEGNDGPGMIYPNEQPWETEKTKYAFVDELDDLRSRVRGKGNIERFDYWLNTYSFLRAIGELGCLRGQLDLKAKAIESATAPAAKAELAREALGLRVRLSRLWERAVALQLAAVDTPGEMGTIDNLERHNRKMKMFLTKHDDLVAGALGTSLPADLEVSTAYAGSPRIIVPTVRSQAGPGESIKLRVIIPDRKLSADAVLHWRPLGKGTYKTLPIQHVSRGVHEVTLPPAREAFEYYITAQTSAGKLVWPAMAPQINQTVVVW